MTRHLTRIALAAGAALFGVVAAARTAGAQERGAIAIGELIAGLGTSARVLVIGAHPDDDDPALLAFLARGRHIRTAYLSITRGEGGTNLLGSETGEALGVVRTAEALAARRIDGADQFFTRAIDFGFSKTAAETQARWGRQEGPEAVLSDVVLVIRAFRPHVVIMMHAGDSTDGNGQHQVAGRLGRDAVVAARDSTRFRGSVWSALALYRALRADETAPGDLPVVRLNVGEYSPLLGRTYADIGADSRGRQRTQGGPRSAPVGPAFVRLVRLSPAGAARSAATAPELFDGVDTSFARLQRPEHARQLSALLDSLPPAIAAVRAAWRLETPSSSVRQLGALVMLAARASAQAGTIRGDGRSDPDVSQSTIDHFRRAHEALVLASGTVLDASAARATVARAAADSSDTLVVSVTVQNRGRDSVRLAGVAITGGAAQRFTGRADLAPESTWRTTLATTPRYETAPWWRSAPRMGDLYGVDIDGRTEQERLLASEGSAVRVRALLRIAGAEVETSVPVVYRSTEPARLAERNVAVVPGITLRFEQPLGYARAGAKLERPLRLGVQSAYPTPRSVTVSLKLPPGLTADSATRTVTMPAGASAVLVFLVRGKPLAGLLGLAAEALVGEDKYETGSSTLVYDHVPPARWYAPAVAFLRVVEVTPPSRPYVGYIAGAGDIAPLMLTQLGIPVLTIDVGALELPLSTFVRFSTIVIGPRAYETQPSLAGASSRLHEYVRGGGRVVVQSGRYEMMQPGVLPYAITIDRPPRGVLLETSPVRLLTPLSRVLTTPNRITDDDFKGWARERAAYMPSSVDLRWQPVLEMNDPGEAPNRGALLVARVGRGTWVYSTISFYRQLSAAVPGAVRLFVNLLDASAASAGQASACMALVRSSPDSCSEPP